MITHGNKQISEIVYARKSSEGGGAVRLTNMIRGAQLVFGWLEPNFKYWLKYATNAAIIGAFGQTDGYAVIKATNVYLNQLAATDQTKATALAGFINEWPYMAYYIIQGELAYYLNGSDALVDGKWTDRIDPTIQWTLNGSCVKNQDNDGFIINNGSAYMYYKSTGTDYNLHNHFIVLAEFTADEDGFIIDFGSFREADKNLSFRKVKNGNANINWKMQGNGSNPGVSVAAPAMSAGRHYLTWEIRDAGNGKDYFKYTQDLAEYQTGGIIPKATNFNGYTEWSIKDFYIGRGVIEGYSNMVGIIHKIAIFVID